jgi:programmed cell death 6-interacting protein
MDLGGEGIKEASKLF